MPDTESVSSACLGVSGTGVWPVTSGALGPLVKAAAGTLGALACLRTVAVDRLWPGLTPGGQRVSGSQARDHVPPLKPHACCAGKDESRLPACVRGADSVALSTF